MPLTNNRKKKHTNITKNGNFQLTKKSSELHFLNHS